MGPGGRRSSSLVFNLPELRDAKALPVRWVLGFESYFLMQVFEGTLMDDFGEGVLLIVPPPGKMKAKQVFTGQ